MDTVQSSEATEVAQAYTPVFNEPNVITISRKSMLRQISSKLGAIIRTEGIVKLDQTRRIAWLTIEIPPRNNMEVMTVESFHGNTCMTDYEAEESVSGIALAHLISQMNILVNDVNYVTLNETYNQLRHYINWAQSLYLRYELSRVEKTGLLNTQRNLLKRLSLICASYSDIIPLAPSAPANPLSMSPDQLIYTGASPPETRYEQLAQELFNVMQEYTPATQ